MCCLQNLKMTNMINFFDRLPCFMLTFIGLASVFGCSEKPVIPDEPSIQTSSVSTKDGGSRSEVIQVTAAVENIDLQERLVTLRGPSGNLETIRVGDEARNLGQVKKGDLVVVTYYQAAAFQVLKPGEAKPSISGEAGAARAEPGDKPGAAVASEITLVAEIMTLDRIHRTAVLKGPEGKTVTVNVRNPENFDKVKVGDTVEIVYQEALAVDVQPVAK